MIDSYILMLSNYAVFSGRTDAPGYWWAFLCHVIVNFALSLLASFWSILYVLSVLYTLATFIPMLACAVRRLHDTGKSGWYMLLNLIPVVGNIIAIVLLAQPSECGDNRYGPMLNTI